MSGDFRFDFSKKSKGKKAVKPVPENLDENAKEYRERARAERKRFVEPTETEYWISIAFPYRDDKDSFLAEYGLRKLGDKYLDGMAVARKLGGEL